jgi:hypothetical protein
MTDHPSCRGKEVTTVNALAIYAVNEHIAYLMAEAKAEREARARKPKRRGFVASILDAARATKAPATPKLASYPRS